MLRLHLNRRPISPDGSAKKVSDLTVKGLKSAIHDVIDEDMETWRETFEILADKKLITILYEVHEDIKTVRIKIIEARGSAYK